MASIPFRLILPTQIHDEMIEHAKSTLPAECCGIIAGTIDKDVARADRMYKLINELASSVAYRSEPRSILAAYRDMDRRGLVELAVYHSHPTAPPIPSRTDLADNFRGESVMHFIVSLRTASPEVRAWWLGERDFREAQWTASAEDV